MVAPLDASAGRPEARLPEADFNVVLYPEVAGLAAQWLTRVHKQPSVNIVPIGIGATRDFINAVAEVAGVPAEPALAQIEWRAQWYAKSVDSTYLTGKRVFIFGDATHAVAAARVAAREMGFTVVGLGTYSREQAREVREAAQALGLDALITDDYLEVEARIAELQPDLVLGTQMERHIAKRLGLPCAVISAPVHVQDFPARHSPQMGIEGANVMFDSWVHPLMMGLEEHLLAMFRDDFEFHAEASPSHLGSAAAPREVAPMPAPAVPAAAKSRQRDPPRRSAAPSSRPGPPMPNRSCARSRSLCAARPVATPSAMPMTAAWPPSPSRPSTMPKRISVPDGTHTPLRVVLVTMDSHIVSAAARAQQALAQELPGLLLSVHAASEWGDDQRALQRCRDDIASGDIVIATMLFMEDHFRPVLACAEGAPRRTATRWSAPCARAK